MRRNGDMVLTTAEKLSKPHLQAWDRNWPHQPQHGLAVLKFIYRAAQVSMPETMSPSAISEDHTTRPYFFDTSVKHSAYLSTPHTWFLPQLSERRLDATAILQRTVYQHIALSNLDNTLPMERTWVGHGVASSKSRPLHHVTIRFGQCEGEMFPTPPTNSGRYKYSYQRMIWLLPTVNIRCIEERGQKLQFVHRMEGSIQITSN